MFKASTGETGSLGAFLKQTIEWLSKKIKSFARTQKQLIIQGCLLKNRGAMAFTRPSATEGAPPCGCPQGQSVEMEAKGKKREFICPLGFR